ncbi:MAG: cell wall hydrolase [Bacillota bacterium]
MKFKKVKVTLTLIMLLFMFLLINNETKAEGYNLELGSRLLEYGSEGADVALLQKLLKDMNYYNGEIDGIYGKGTIQAVKSFQKANNLSVDGIVGPKTIEFFKENSLFNRMHVDREEVIILARVINGEARGENFEGKVAVGAVILNRVESDDFPDTIREVILQQGQFSSLLDGQANPYPVESSIAAAKAALIGYDPSLNSLYFYNPEVATNLDWIRKRPIILEIGNHVFAR